MTNEIPASEVLTTAEHDHLLAMASTLINLKKEAHEEPTLENNTCALTFLNFMQAYLRVLSGDAEEQKITTDAFAENLINYERYWDSSGALLFSEGHEASGALKAVRLMMDILGVAKKV